MNKLKLALAVLMLLTVSAQAQQQHLEIPNYQDDYTGVVKNGDTHYGTYVYQSNGVWRLECPEGQICAEGAAPIIVPRPRQYTYLLLRGEYTLTVNDDGDLIITTKVPLAY